jgi:hypothetical protein
MAEKRPALKLVEIPDGYTAPANAAPAELQKAAYSRAIAEGRQRERADLAPTVAKLVEQTTTEIKKLHTAELDRSVRMIAKGAHRDGVLQGTVLGALLVALLCFGAWIILKETVLLNTATQRVNYPNPPALTDTYDGAVTYERNPREPQDAH